MYCVGVMVILLANISLIPPILSYDFTCNITFMSHFINCEELFALWTLSVMHGPIHSFIHGD